MTDNFEFTVEKKGYNTSQVDNAIEDLKSQNLYLKARVNELEQKLDAAGRLIRRFSETENGLRQNIADSKRAAAEMLSDTKERSDVLLDRARESCGEIISDLDLKIADRMNTVDVIRAEVTSFKDQLFALYSSHIDMIESIAATAENFVYEPDYTKVAEAVDEFESHEEPHAELPEFVEYPQESIFKDYGTDEGGEFVMNGEDEDTSNVFSQTFEEAEITEDGAAEYTEEEEFVGSGTAEDDMFAKDEPEPELDMSDIPEDEYNDLISEFVPVEEEEEEETTPGEEFGMFIGGDDVQDGIPEEIPAFSDIDIPAGEYEEEKPAEKSEPDFFAENREFFESLMITDEEEPEELPPVQDTVEEAAEEIADPAEDEVEEPAEEFADFAEKFADFAEEEAEEAEEAAEEIFEEEEEEEPAGEAAPAGDEEPAFDGGDIEDEYYKFLADFINEDDGIPDDPQ